MKPLCHIATSLLATLATAALLLLGGCAERTWPDLGAITYEPIVVVSQMMQGGGGSFEESATPSNIYPKDEKFGVWVMALDENLSWEYGGSHAEVLVNNQEVAWNGSEWSTAEPCKWPVLKQITVAAYSPADAQAEFSYKNGVMFNNVDVLNEKSRELMWAGPVYDKKYGASGGVVNLPFTSALCAVQFSVIPHLPEHVSVRVRSLSVEQLRHQGSFVSLPTPSWSTSGNHYKQPFFEGAEVVAPGEIRSLGAPVWLMPQMAKMKVVLVCDFLYEDATLPNQVLEIEKDALWEPGRQYAYTLKIYTNKISFLHDSITGLTD